MPHIIMEGDSSFLAVLQNIMRREKLSCPTLAQLAGLGLVLMIKIWCYHLLVHRQVFPAFPKASSGCWLRHVCFPRDCHEAFDVYCRHSPPSKLSASRQTIFLSPRSHCHIINHITSHHTGKFVKDFTSFIISKHISYQSFHMDHIRLHHVSELTFTNS